MDNKCGMNGYGNNTLCGMPKFYQLTLFISSFFESVTNSTG